MFSLKRIIGTRVIEVLHTLYLVKGYLRMTLGTVLSEFICMNILVTAGAFSVGEAGEFLRLYPILNGFFMAKQAINTGVFAP